MKAPTTVVLLLLVTALAPAGAQPPPAAASPQSTGTVLVTGSNRGLGFEFVKQYAAAGWTVIATTRDPANAIELRELATSNARIAVEPLDVVDDKSLSSLVAKYRDVPIDLLINNAGVLGDMQGQTLGSLDQAEFERVMAVNVYGPLAVTEAFLENVAVSRQKKIVSITSRSGIISQPGWRGPYFYRASKIALNMVTRMLADELRGRGVIVALVSPQPTNTDMLRELIGPERAASQANPEDAVAGLIELIENVTVETSGVPLFVDGTVLPW
jgi:NAD(P)-dependent dehydrogenase (short-subunit alcohol dehydrogenase family)